ncbi:MAG: hypothetical protein LBR23_01435 [Spirochaetaceae bacterium]|jgi:hypothetical protein|nr:hypothetical protein [Spirochaetaceae bacterium]
MRKQGFLVIAALVLMVLSGCSLIAPADDEPANDSPTEDDSPTTLPSSKTFWAQTATNGAWYQITAAKAGESAHCIVYGDTTLKAASSTTGKYTAAQAQALANEYETYVWSQITGAFGDIYDVDGNGKVILLLLDIVDGYPTQTGGGYVAGYFDSTHMLSGAYSNRADMLFMDVNPGTVGDATFNATMAHELQHLINWSETVAKNRSEKELWINEGLSTGAEYVYSSAKGSGGDPGDRVNYYNAVRNPSSQYYSQTGSYNTFFYWDSSLMDYSTDFLFFQYLRIHASNGTGIYKDIIQNSYGDYRAVTASAASRFSPSGFYTGGESDTEKWSVLLTKWVLANAIQHTSNFYGYKNDAAIGSLQHLTFTGTNGTSISLRPGEAIFSRLGTTRTYSNGNNIKYAAISKNGDSSVIDEDGTYTTSTPDLLTLNVDVNCKGAASSGKLADYQSGPMQPVTSGGLSASVVSGGGASVPLLPETYPLSFGDMRRIREREAGR